MPDAADAFLSVHFSIHTSSQWRHTTSAKLSLVNCFLAREGLMPLDVTSWVYEWAWKQSKGSPDFSVMQPRPNKVH